MFLKFKAIAYYTTYSNKKKNKGKIKLLKVLNN